MECVSSRNVVLVLFCGCLAAAWMTEGAAAVPTSANRPPDPDTTLRLIRQLNDSNDGNSTSNSSVTTGSGSTWFGAHWYWLLVLLVALFVFVLLGATCCYKRNSLHSDIGRIQLSSIKATMPSPNLTGFTSPVSTSVGDRESYHGNLVVSPGILSTEQTPVASPQLQFTSTQQQQQQQRSPRNSTTNRYGHRRKNHSPGNSSGSEETIRHATGTPSISSLASVSSSVNGRISRAQSFTGVGQQSRMSRRRSGSQVKVISLSRGTSSLSVTSAASNSSAHSAASNQSVHSNGACQSDSSQHTYLAVDVQVHVNREMTQHEKNIYTAAVLAQSAAKLAQSAASYGEEPIVPVSKLHKTRTSQHRRYYSTNPGLRQASNDSPTKRTSPSHSLPMPVSHTIHYSTPIHLVNGDLLHDTESPVVSLDTCVRGEQCAAEKTRPTSLSSNDTGDEMFTPKQSLTSTVNTIGPPPSSNHHKTRTNLSLEKDRDRGRTKKSKVITTNNTDEVKKKKRHTHHSLLTTQPPKELARFVGDEAPEMPAHMRSPHQLTGSPPPPDNTSQSTPAKLQPNSSDNPSSAPTSNNVSAIGGSNKEEKANGGGNEEEEGGRAERKKAVPSLGSSGQLKRTTSASTRLSGSLSSIVDELNYSHGQGLKRQYSVPNISQSTSSSHANHMPRPLSGTSLSASGYAPSGASTNTLDSISAIKPNELYHNNVTLSYPLRKLLEGEQDHCGAMDPRYISNTSSAASSGMAEKAPVSPALPPLISANGVSAHITSYNNNNSDHVKAMYGGRPSVTGLASAEV